MSGYFECACCGTVDLSDESFCDACLLCECGEDDPCCKELLVDGAAGIYVPKDFAMRYLSNKSDRENWGISEEDYAVLCKGPDEETYWDVWARIEGYAEAALNGKRWVLSQDGDLWAQCIGKAES